MIQTSERRIFTRDYMQESQAVKVPRTVRGEKQAVQLRLIVPRQPPSMNQEDI